MALISFGYRVNMSTIDPPTDPAGYIVAYDLDGILKQKDHQGIVTLVGPTGPQGPVGPTGSGEVVNRIYKYASEELGSYVIIPEDKDKILHVLGGENKTFFLNDVSLFDNNNVYVIDTNPSKINSSLIINLIGYDLILPDGSLTYPTLDGSPITIDLPSNTITTIRKVPYGDFIYVSQEVCNPVNGKQTKRYDVDLTANPTAVIRLQNEDKYKIIYPSAYKESEYRPTAPIVIDNNSNIAWCHGDEFIIDTTYLGNPALVTIQNVYQSYSETATYFDISVADSNNPGNLSGNTDDGFTLECPVNTITRLKVDTEDFVIHIYQELQSATYFTMPTLFYNMGGTVSATNSTSAIYRTGSLNIGIGTASDSRFVVSSSGGTNSLVVDESGNIYNGDTSYNTKFGYQALYNSYQSYELFNSYNTVVGYQAAYKTGLLPQDFVARHNTVVGYQSLYNNIDGEFNVAIGACSLYKTTTSGNSAIGYYSLYNNINGFSNTAVGSQTLQYNTDGQNNTAIGYQSLSNNTIGSYNIAIGAGSGLTSIIGSPNINSNNSIFIGYNSKSFGTSSTNEIVIGATAIGNGSNTVSLGNDNIAKTYLKGNIQLPTVPTTSAGTYSILTRNDITGEVEKIVPTYKVFVGTLTQNGSYVRIDPGDEFIIGEQYFATNIAYISQSVYDDFSNIGYVGSYTPFIATGMTAGLWQYNSTVFNYDGVSVTTQLTQGDNFIIGQEYVVQYLGQGGISIYDDFTNIGYTEINTLFTATGTTASSHTSSNTSIYKYDEDALPTVDVLENTLGITLTPEFDSVQTCKLVSNLPVFIENKTITTPFFRYKINESQYNFFYTASGNGITRMDNSTLLENISLLGFQNGLPQFTNLSIPIEIRVYN
jgi:hypothetical protein